jgi:preprotein translocase subunit SecY
MSDDLKRSGGFVPGIRPGNETSEFLDNVMSQITFPGSLFLAALAVFPAIVVKLMGMQQGWALFYGGTSLLIMVGVAIDTIQAKISVEDNIKLAFFISPFLSIFLEIQNVRLLKIIAKVLQ